MTQATIRLPDAPPPTLDPSAAADDALEHVRDDRPAGRGARRPSEAGSA